MLKLTEDHVARAFKIAHWYGRRARRAEVSDLESAALEGLAQAACAFDPDAPRRDGRHDGGKRSFWTFAFKRILGEMKDELRRFDHLTREQRERTSAGSTRRSRYHSMPASRRRTASPRLPSSTRSRSRETRSRSSSSEMPSAARARGFPSGSASSSSSASSRATRTRSSRTRSTSRKGVRRSFAAPPSTRCGKRSAIRSWTPLSASRRSRRSP